jgi:hypothetical protein
MHRMLEEDGDDEVVMPTPNKGCLRSGTAVLLLAVAVLTIVVLYIITARMQTGTNTNQLPVLRDTGLVNQQVLHQRDTAAYKAGTKSSIEVEKEVTAIRVKQTGTAHITGTSLYEKDIAHLAVKMQGAQKHGGDADNQRPAGQPLQTIGHGDSTSFVKQDSTGIPATSEMAEIPAANAQNQTMIMKPVDTSSTKKRLPAAEPAETMKPWFGAGIALQQLLPVDGQTAAPYNAQGRKGSLADYIPSAYLRVYHGKKFLQVEFKYGAPQYTKDIVYSKTPIATDTMTGITTYTSNRVKKTYYHQLPVSIHYTPVPNFSIGAGIQWNHFESAVIQQETGRSVSNTGSDSVLTSKIVTFNHDSATVFARSYLQFMAEMQYTYKRVTLGARYAWGLQPYLTFASPVTGQLQKERNASLNIFLRYELWQSGKR